MMKKIGLRSGVIVLHPFCSAIGGIQGVDVILLPFRTVCLMSQLIYQRSSGWMHGAYQGLSGNESTKISDAQVAIFNFLFNPDSDEEYGYDSKNSGKNLTIPENNLSVHG